VAQINCDSPGCRWATSYHETRAFSESAAVAAQAIRDVLPKADVKTMRPPQAGDYSFNNIGLPSFLMLSSTMPEALRKQKNYYDVSGCGANIAWHTENDTLEIADRDILLKDMRVYLSRILVPINYTREPRFRHDPAYTVPPLPTLAVAAELPELSEELRRHGLVELMRGQNRFIAAIRAATKLVEGALA
jgi:hypothetical protein